MWLYIKLVCDYAKRRKVKFAKRKSSITAAQAGPYRHQAHARTIASPASSSEKWWSPFRNRKHYRSGNGIRRWLGNRSSGCQVFNGWIIITQPASWAATTATTTGTSTPTAIQPLPSLNGQLQPLPFHQQQHPILPEFLWFAQKLQTNQQSALKLIFINP